MFCHRSIGLAVLSVLVLGVSSQADEPATRPNPPSSEYGAKIGPVQSARALMGATIKTQQGDVYGKVQDIGIDVGNGSVADIFVAPVAAKGAKADSVTVPFKSLRLPTKDDVVLMEPTSDKSPIKPADPGTKSLVITLSKANHLPVHNDKGDKLGEIVDFALARETGVIAFAVLVREGDKSDTRYPIPLSALVVPQNSREWILELPEDILAKTPTFKQSDWPTMVSGAWTEYVHVRYGRSPFGGVQRRLKEQ